MSHKHAGAYEAVNRPPADEILPRTNRLYYACEGCHVVTEHRFFINIPIDADHNLDVWECLACESVDYRLESH